MTMFGGSIQKVLPSWLAKVARLPIRTHVIMIFMTKVTIEAYRYIVVSSRKKSLPAPKRELTQQEKEELFVKATTLDLNSFSISDKTKQNLKLLGGLLTCRKKADSLYHEKMPQGLLEQEIYANMGTSDATPLRQPGGDMSVEDVRGKATQINSEYDRIMKEVVRNVGLDPDKELIVHQASAEKEDFTTKVLVIPQLKGEERCHEKAEQEYHGDANRLCDVKRSSIVCTTEDQIIGVIDGLRNNNCEIMQMENRFANPLFTGVRDLVINLKVQDHICEVQVHLLELAALKSEAHVFYEHFHEHMFVAGTDEAYKQRMGMFEALGEVIWRDEEKIEGEILKILEGDDEEKLYALVEVMRQNMLADFDLCLKTMQRQYALLKSRRGEQGESEEELALLHNMGITFGNQGEYDTALELYHKVLSGREALLGKDYEETLKTVNAIGVLYDTMGNNEIALTYYKRALEGYETSLGEDHPDTLRTVNNIGNFYMIKIGDDDNALIYYERAIKGYETLLGEKHPNTLTLIRNKAIVLERAGLKPQLRTHLGKYPHLLAGETWNYQ